MLEFVINKRSIHLQTPGPQRSQLCGAWKMYGSNTGMRKATEDEIAKYKLCGTCQKAAAKRNDVPPLPIRVFITPDDREIIIEALANYADRYEPKEPINAVLAKFT